MPTRLTDAAWQFELTGVNAYLVDDPGQDDREGGLTLIDTGTPFDAGALAEEVRATGHGVDDIERVLVTHYDMDHVGGFGRLVGLDATVYMGSPDREFLTGERRPPLTNHKGALQRVFSLLDRADGLDVVQVGDGDEIGSFTAYYTPGHTPGHFAYVSDVLDVGFVGDLVRETGGRFEPSPWAISYDMEAVHESIHDLADREPAVECLCPGHGVPFLKEGSIRLAETGQRIE